MARYTTNNANPIFDLTPYKCAGKEYAGQPWRLIEVGYVATYASGIIDSYGYLLGLQNQFRSSYFYNGYMELQIGCKSAAESTTGSQWPVARTAPTCAIGSCL
ncbi:hypothetical protein [Sphingorhabdus sp.]|uniref:hypothetical protein n=1 Tax=Sphingorhabdus sp. TaxID=1902408 RepID=UPI003340A508